MKEEREAIFTREPRYSVVAVLHVADGSCEDIVATTDFFIATDNYSRTGAVRREFLKGARPSATGVRVAGLLRKDALIEISTVAVLR